MNDHENTPAILRFASRHPFRMAMFGTALMLLSFPPVGWWPMAWIAVIPWTTLIATREFAAKRPMLGIWFAALIFWAAEAYYITIPHPALWIAWGLLFFYLSIYPLLYVWIGRKLVHGQRVPLWIAAPVVFTSMEWARAHMLTGFGFSMLANTQYQVPLTLQICDVAGGYGLTFLMVMFASGLLTAWIGFRSHGKKFNAIFGVVVSVLVVALVVGYGKVRLQEYSAKEGKVKNIVVVQGNIDTRFPKTQAETDAYLKQLTEDYFILQREWIERKDRIVPDLIVWPEGKYPVDHILPGGDAELEEVREAFRNCLKLVGDGVLNSPPGFPGPTGWEAPGMIVGCGTFDPETDRSYNSVMTLSGFDANRYDKMHLVPFGEFVPFAKQFPFLTKLTPIGTGWEAGKHPVIFSSWRRQMVVVPNICFESAVTHLVRESVAYAESTDQPADMIVNVTDDGWFYGHAVLDHHLACNVMRAVENRKPMIVAANTGISAYIQSTGEILLQGPRRKSEVLELAMELKTGKSWYLFVGDWPPIIMTIVCLLGIIVPAREPTNPTKRDAEESKELAKSKSK